MPENPDADIAITIGGDAHGPVVAGHGNHVEQHADAAPARQDNTAHPGGTVFAVTDGDMHIYQDNDAPE
ncbi:MAG: hypothetical protein HOQ24_02110 [Mycobacteriaceae bacterium]|nr:hypothetical protein [Mycobacteriaceae bacterium]